MFRLYWSAGIALFAGIACSQQSGVELSAREAAADKAAFQAVCGSCHALSLVSGLRTEAEWVDEIQQMVKIGAKGTDEQFDRVMRVLSRTLTKVNVNLANAAEIAPVLDISERTAEALVKYVLPELVTKGDLAATKTDLERAMDRLEHRLTLRLIGIVGAFDAALFALLRFVH